MSYTYKFYPAGNGTVTQSPKNEYIANFQESLNEQFYNASDVFTILEEQVRGSEEFVEVDVRINKVIDTSSGANVGNDFRKLLFKDLAHETMLGQLYSFDSNKWIVTNLDKIKSLSTSVTVRRCNNVLRWFDNDGGYYEVPCILSYLIKENRDYSTSGSALVIPSGMVECIVQYNAKSNLIKANQRFLFGNSGNWTAYRVEGGGISNFLNTMTADNTSAGLITLSLATDYVNSETDDLTNGIANKTYDNAYTVTLNQTVITGSASQTRTLQAVVKLGTTLVDRNVVWSSSSSAVATVNSSGVVTMVSNGSAVITCALENNDSINDTCAVTVSASPVDVYQIVYSPEENVVLEDKSKTWTFTLYKNGSAQGDAFVFSLNPHTVPSDNYTYLVLTGNTFIIQNRIMCLTDYLTVTATSGSYSTILNITLRGKW